MEGKQILNRSEIEFALIMNRELVKTYDVQIEGCLKQMEFFKKAKHEKYAIINGLLDQLHDLCGEELNDKYASGDMYKNILERASELTITKEGEVDGYKASESIRD